MYVNPDSVAHPGIPRGGTNSGGREVLTYYLTNFSRKLHENEEILAEGRRVPRAPPPPPLIHQYRLIILDDGGHRGMGYVTLASAVHTMR